MTAATISDNTEKMEPLYNTGTTGRMQDFMNRLQTFVYAFAFLYCLYLIRHDEDHFALILFVTFLGGFLFSLLWEANGRYVFPYFVFLIPAAAMGLSKCCQAITLCLNKFKGRKNGKSDQELNSNLKEG